MPPPAVCGGSTSQGNGCAASIVDTAGDPVVATPDGLAVWISARGRHIGAFRSSRPAGEPGQRCQGRLAWSRMGRHHGLRQRPGNAALYRVDGEIATCVVDGLTISNGPAFDDDSGRLYLADTAVGIVNVFDYDPATGDLGSRRRDDRRRRRHVVDRSRRAGALHRYDRAGQLNGVVELPTANPALLAFGGADGGAL